MQPKKLLPLLFSVGVAAAVNGAEVEDNCAMCHDVAPVSADHMPVDVVSVEECTMCHAPEGDDALFRAIHTTHKAEGVECDSCHAGAADANRLEQLLGQ